MVPYWFPALRHVGGSCVGFRPTPFVQLQTMRPWASAVGVKMSSPCLMLTVSTILFGSSDSRVPSVSCERIPRISSDSGIFWLD